MVTCAKTYFQIRSRSPGSRLRTSTCLWGGGTIQPVIGGDWSLGTPMGWAGMWGREGPVQGVITSCPQGAGSSLHRDPQNTSGKLGLRSAVMASSVGIVIISTSAEGCFWGVNSPTLLAWLAQCPGPIWSQRQRKSPQDKSLWCSW